jgi:hypothetical protein
MIQPQILLLGDRIWLCIERGEPQLSINSMKKSFTLQSRDLCGLKKLVWGAKFALYENFSCFDCTKTIVFIRIILHVMGRGKFQGKIITLFSFLSPPRKGYNLHTLVPQQTFTKKWWALKVLRRFKAIGSHSEFFLGAVVDPTPAGTWSR